MFTDILRWLALGAIAGSLLGFLLVWVVRQIFSRCWLAWGLIEPGVITSLAGVHPLIPGITS